MATEHPMLRRLSGELRAHLDNQGIEIEWDDSRHCVMIRVQAKWGECFHREIRDDRVSMGDHHHFEMLVSRGARDLIHHMNSKSAAVTDEDKYKARSRVQHVALQPTRAMYLDEPAGVTTYPMNKSASLSSDPWRHTRGTEATAASVAKASVVSVEELKKVQKLMERDISTEFQKAYRGEFINGFDLAKAGNLCPNTLSDPKNAVYTEKKDKNGNMVIGGRRAGKTAAATAKAEEELPIMERLQKRTQEWLQPARDKLLEIDPTWGAA